MTFNLPKLHDKWLRKDDFWKTKMLKFYTFCCPKFAQKVVICSKTGLTGNLVLPLKTLNPATIFGRPLFYPKMHHFGAQKTVVLRKIMNIFSVKKAHKNAQFLQ